MEAGPVPLLALAVLIHVALFTAVWPVLARTIAPRPGGRSTGIARWLRLALRLGGLLLALSAVEGGLAALVADRERRAGGRAAHG